MAKRVNSVQLKGNFEVETMEVTEESKEGTFVYDLLAELRLFDGKHVTIAIKEEFPVEPKE